MKNLKPGTVSLRFFLFCLFFFFFKVRRHCFSKCLVGNRGKKFRRPRGAELCRAESRGGGLRGPHKGAAEPGRTRGAAGKADAWTWAQAGHSWLGSLHSPTALTPARAVCCGSCDGGCFWRSRLRPPGGTVQPIVNPISIFFRDTSPYGRPWAISRRRHLDSPNLWCGGHRCSPVLTSLFGK